jgi:hypothetical protein
MITKTDSNTRTVQAGDSSVVVQDLDAKSLPLKHEFPNGLYTREMFIPRGVMVAGRYHRGNTLNTILSGRVAVLMDGKIFEIKGPHVFESGPGSKIVFAHEDTRWMTTHLNPSNERDLSILQERLMDDEKSYPPEMQNQMNAFLQALTPTICLGEPQPS